MWVLVDLPCEDIACWEFSDPTVSGDRPKEPLPRVEPRRHARCRHDRREDSLAVGQHGVSRPTDRPRGAIAEDMTAMEMRGKRVLICDCEASMPLDAGKLAEACRAAGGEGEIELNTQLCRAQLGNFQQAILGQDSTAASGPSPVRAAAQRQSR